MLVHVVGQVVLPGEGFHTNRADQAQVLDPGVPLHARMYKVPYPQGRGGGGPGGEFIKSYLVGKNIKL